MNTQIDGTQPVSTQSTFRKWLPMFIIALSLAIIVIDGTILNVSQKSIINDLNTDLKTIQWAITSYSLVIAALTIFGGRLGDLFGRKKMFILGAILFAFGSFLTTISPNVTYLLLGWSIIEGIGAALMTPAASALLVSNYEGRDRGTAFAIFGATAGGASAFGPIIGGFLSKYGTNISDFLANLFDFNNTISIYFKNFAGWRWAFGINVIIVILVLIGSNVIKDFHTKGTKKVNLDLPGVLLSSAGLTSIVFGIIESSKYGWFWAKKPFEILGKNFDLAGLSATPYFVLVGIALLVAFIFWENRQKKAGLDPMIDLEIFRNKTFSFGMATQTAVFSGFVGVISYGVVFFYLTVLKLDALGAGLSLIPLSIMTFIMAPLSAKLGHRYDPKNIVQIGILFALAGSILLYTELDINATTYSFIPSLLIFGTGFGLMISQINNMVLSAVDTKLAGVASGINGTIREVGRSFGVALIGAAFISTLSSGLKDNLNSNPNIPLEAKNSIIQAVDNGDDNIATNETKSDKQVVEEPKNQAVIAGIVAGSKAQGKEIPVQVAQSTFLTKFRQTENEIETEVKKSIVSGSRIAVTFTCVFIFIGFLLSFGLSKRKKVQA
jgi:MFS family permease